MFNLNNNIDKNTHLSDYQSFLEASAHVIRRTPTHLIEQIVLQQAINSYDISFARKDALEKINNNNNEKCFFDWLNRSITLPGCQAIYSFPETQIWVGDFSNDGKYIAYGSSDNMVHVLLESDSNETLTLEGHTDDISFCVFNPNKGNKFELITIASCRPYRKGNDLIVWSIEDGSKRQIYDTLEYCVDCKFDNTGNMLAIVGNKMFCKILTKLETDYEEHLVFEVPGSNCCVFTDASTHFLIGTLPTNRYISDSDDEETNQEEKEKILLYIFKIDSMNRGKVSPLDAVCTIDQTEVDGTVAMCCTRNKNKEILICATGQNTVHFFLLNNLATTTTKEFIFKINPHDSEGLYTLSTTTNGALLISSEDQTVSVWQFVNDQDDTTNTNYKKMTIRKKTTLRGHSSPVKKITEYPDANKSKKIMTTSDDGTSRIFNIELATAESDPPGHLQSISATEFCYNERDGQYYIASSDSDGNLKFWQPDGITLIWNVHLKSQKVGMSAITSLKSFQDKIIVGMHSTVHIINAMDGSTQFTSYDFDDWINAVGFNNNKIAAAGDNNTLKLLTYNNEKIVDVQTFDMQSSKHPVDTFNSILSVAMSNNGKYTLSGANDSIVRIWSVETLKEVSSLKLDGWVVSVNTSNQEGDENVTLGIAGIKTGLIYLFTCDVTCSLLSKVSAGEENTMISWCSFFLNSKYIIANSSDKIIYMFELKYSNDEYSLTLVNFFHAFAPFGSPDGIGGQGSQHDNYIVNGCQGGRIYFLKWCE